LRQPKEHDISKRTIERSLAKAEGREPKPKPIAARPLKSKPKLETHPGIVAARNYYVSEFMKLDGPSRTGEWGKLMAAINSAVDQAG
jgi:hypothetical protein